MSTESDQVQPGPSETRKLRALEDENTRLKRLIAHLTLYKYMLAER